MYFRNANSNELNDIYKLYQSVKGTKFCVWDEGYPGMMEINHDFETDNLFVMIEGERIAGACSIVPENEMDDMSCWSCNNSNAKEIARIVVDEEFRGQGLAYKMVSNMIDILKTRGYNEVRISASTGNIPALKTYEKLGFVVVSEQDMYGGHYYLLKKCI